MNDTPHADGENIADALEKDALYTTIRALPKVELHRHLEGSIRLSTLVDIAQQYDIDVPTFEVEGLRPSVQMMPDSPQTVEHFLSKFATLRKFYCAPEVIQRITREAIEDAALDNIRYLELRFTPRTLGRLKGYPLDDVIVWVADAAHAAAQEFDTKVMLIVSINRHEGVIEAEKIARAAFRHLHQGIVALDLAGQEDGYPATPYASIFKEAREHGMQLTIHAGEWAGPLNVRFAIEKLGAKRIGHGVRALEDHSVVQLAREQGTIFEVCPTSNVQSGVVYKRDHHPLRDMCYLDLGTTLNTDDPAICDVTLTQELYLTMTSLDLTLVDIKRMILTSAEGAFLPDDARQSLVDEFKIALGL